MKKKQAKDKQMQQMRQLSLQEQAVRVGKRKAADLASNVLKLR